MEFFPYDEVRPVQEELMEAIDEALQSKEHMVVHAPTGLGKTVAALVPALKKAEEENLTIFFLTSRHTQHDIAVDTLKSIRDKHNINIPVVDVIGKKWMCLVPAIDMLSAREFHEYCKTVREEKKCEFYNNTYKDNTTPTVLAESVIASVADQSPLGVQELVAYCEQEKVCPYEIAMLLSGKAKVIVADYYYIFHPKVMQSFFKKSEKTIEESIIIVDEAHNLPARIRELLSARLTTTMIKDARKEVEELEEDELIPVLDHLQETLLELIDLDEERTVRPGTFSAHTEEELIELLEAAAERTREQQKRSSCGSIAHFLRTYEEGEQYINYMRHVKSDRGQRIELLHRCLDPSTITASLFERTYCSILMSGTLQPVEMYKDVLGIDAATKVFPSPFPKENRKQLIIPDVTTKFSDRSLEGFKKIADHLTSIVNTVPGNTLIFFPSYALRDQIYQHCQNIKKTVFQEVPGLSKEDKEDLLNRFQQYREVGAALFAVTSGSFGEGVDLPGDLLKCVVVVGVPLSKPDRETQALIDYYDKKFGKGWEYGYILPTLSKVAQNAGRCIRSERDKGLIIFMDKRYQWERYRACLGEEVEGAVESEEKIKQFFGNV